MKYSSSVSTTEKHCSKCHRSILTNERYYFEVVPSGAQYPICIFCKNNPLQIKDKEIKIIELKMEKHAVCAECGKEIKEPKDEVMGQEAFRDVDAVFWKIYCKNCANMLKIDDETFV